MAQDILFPPGRLIMGSLYEGSKTDADGNPRVTKTGPNVGSAYVQFFFGVAIPKGAEPHWAQTAWGQLIMAVGAAAFPQVYQSRTFAWKIIDGDSTELNEEGRRPCDREGAPGHWIVKFSGGFQPKLFQQTGPRIFSDLTAPGLIRKGYWIQVAGNVKDNVPSKKPGVYLNPSMVLFVRADAEITSGPDAATVFEGAAISEPLPGMSALPAGFGAAPARVALPALQPPAAPALPTYVTPNPGILALPALPALPAVVAVPPAPAEPTLTPKGLASGYSYADYRKGGWSDEVMRANGIIV